MGKCADKVKAILRHRGTHRSAPGKAPFDTGEHIAQYRDIKPVFISPSYNL
jgi:hypothetical protein